MPFRVACNFTPDSVWHASFPIYIHDEDIKVEIEHDSVFYLETAHIILDISGGSELHPSKAIQAEETMKKL